MYRKFDPHRPYHVKLQDAREARECAAKAALVASRKGAFLPDTVDR
jgi:hypothetical protein